MKKSILLLIVLLTAVFFIGCDKEDEMPAMSRTALKFYGPDFAEIQSRLYLTGSSPVKRSGACWVLKSTASPDLNAIEFATPEDFVQESPITDPGIYQMRITGLQPDTVYYVRFFATNDEGTSFSYPVRVRTTKIYDNLSFVEAGTFSMGNAGGPTDEMPIHKVELEHSFYISKKEITNSEYCKFLNESSVSPNGNSGDELWVDMASEDVLIHFVGDAFVPKAGMGDKPAICVTWFGAQAYCRWAGGSLPTEAEWEYTAKGGRALESFKFSGSDTADKVAWFNSDRLHAGGEKEANSLKVYDLSGNVAEWCSDWYEADAYGKSALKSPEGPKSGTDKVIRGGSYVQAPVTVTGRSSMKPGTASPHVGFRVLIRI